MSRYYITNDSSQELAADTFFKIGAGIIDAFAGGFIPSLISARTPASSVALHGLT